MNERGTSLEEANIEELQPYVNQISIKLGVHGDMSEHFKAYEQYPLATHAWPERTAKELTQTHFTMLTLDGLNVSSAEFLNQRNEERYTGLSSINNPIIGAGWIPNSTQRDKIWINIPANPKYFGLEHYDVLCGDFLPGNIVPDQTHALLGAYLTSQINRDFLEHYTNDFSFVPTEIIVGKIAIATLLSASIAKEANKMREEKRVSRRDFLKMAGAATGAAVLAATKISAYDIIRGAVKLADHTENDKLEAFCLEIASAFEGVDSPDVVDFRNALLIDKSAEAIRDGLVGEGTKVPIILGRDHGKNLLTLMTDPQKREEIYINFDNYVRAGLDYAIQVAQKSWGDSYNFGAVKEAALQDIRKNATGIGIIRIHGVDENTPLDQQRQEAQNSMEAQTIFTSSVLDKYFG